MLGIVNEFLSRVSYYAHKNFSFQKNYVILITTSDKHFFNYLIGSRENGLDSNFFGRTYCNPTSVRNGLIVYKL